MPLFALARTELPLPDGSEAAPGTCVFLPRGVEHSFSIDRDGARALIMITPAGLEEAFLELTGDADAEESGVTAR